MRSAIDTVPEQPHTHTASHTGTLTHWRYLSERSDVSAQSRYVGDCPRAMYRVSLSLTVVLDRQRFWTCSRRKCSDRFPKSSAREWSWQWIVASFNARAVISAVGSLVRSTGDVVMYSRQLDTSSETISVALVPLHSSSLVHASLSWTTILEQKLLTAITGSSRDARCCPAAPLLGGRSSGCHFLFQTRPLASSLVEDMSTCVVRTTP